MPCIITARDFSNNTRDPLRDEWTVGKIRHVIAALQGQRVAITTEVRTGHTVIDVELIRAFEGGPCRGPRVTIRTFEANGTHWDTNYYLRTVGHILPLTGDTSRQKWDAIDTHREEISLATEYAREHVPAGQAGTWGAWSGDLTEDGAIARYEPHTGNDHFKSQWGRFYHTTVTAAQIAEQREIRAARSAAHMAAITAPGAKGAEEPAF